MNIMSNGVGEGIAFKYSELRTLTGLTLDEALKRLQAKLEPAAYKQVEGGGAKFTDIKPAWLTEVLTQVFGICGIGWNYWFDEPEVTATAQKSSKGREYIDYDAQIKMGHLIYVLTLPDGRLIESDPIRATGGSNNENQEYAIRGAVTNMLGMAASKLTWQLSIYKGQDFPKVVDERPWYTKALEYGLAHPELLKKPLGETEEGKRVITNMRGMIGAGKWWNAEAHFKQAIQAYTGFKVPEEMGWKDFNRIVRIYAGPFAIAGEEIKDVAFNHFLKPSEWQAVMNGIPVMENMVLTEEMADALNVLIPNAQTYLKDKKLDTATMAEQLRQHFVKLAETVPSDETISSN